MVSDIASGLAFGLKSGKLGSYLRFVFGHYPETLWAMLPSKQSMPLKGRGLIKVAEMASPRNLMGLPTWSRSARHAVEAVYPEIDPGHEQVPSIVR